MTKLHEEAIRGSLSEISARLENKTSVKGECVIFIEGFTKPVPADKTDIETIVEQKIAETNLRPSHLARQLADETRIPRKQLYDMILKLTGRN